MQTQAYWCDGGYIMNHSVSLQNSPCAESGSFWYMENSASDLFPDASLLKERFNACGFFAVKLQDSSGGHIGVLAGISRAALHPAKSDIHVIKLFAARAAAELERKLALGETLALLLISNFCRRDHPHLFQVNIKNLITKRTR